MKNKAQAQICVSNRMLEETIYDSSYIRKELARHHANLIASKLEFSIRPEMFNNTTKFTSEIIVFFSEKELDAYVREAAQKILARKA